MASETTVSMRDMLFSFKGRIRRRDWWLWSVVCAVSYQALYLALGTVLFGSSDIAFESLSVRTTSSLVLELALAIPMTAVSSAIATKRAHDRGMAAWPFVLIVVASAIMVFLPPIEQAFAAMQQDLSWLTLALAFQIVVLIASLYSLVELGFMDGTLGPNRFGRSPKGIGGDTAQATAEVFE